MVGWLLTAMYFMYCVATAKLHVTKELLNRKDVSKSPHFIFTTEKTAYCFPKGFPACMGNMSCCETFFHSIPLFHNVVLF